MKPGAVLTLLGAAILIPIFAFGLVMVAAGRGQEQMPFWLAVVAIGGVAALIGGIVVDVVQTLRG